MQSSISPNNYLSAVGKVVLWQPALVPFVDSRSNIGLSAIIHPLSHTRAHGTGKPWKAPQTVIPRRAHLSENATTGSAAPSRMVSVYGFALVPTCRRSEQHSRDRRVDCTRQGWTVCGFECWFSIVSVLVRYPHLHRALPSQSSGFSRIPLHVFLK